MAKNKRQKKQKGDNHGFSIGRRKKTKVTDSFKKRNKNRCKKLVNNVKDSVESCNLIQPPTFEKKEESTVYEHKSSLSRDLINSLDDSIKPRKRRRPKPNRSLNRYKCFEESDDESYKTEVVFKPPTFQPLLATNQAKNKSLTSKEFDKTKETNSTLNI